MFGVLVFYCNKKIETKKRWDFSCSFWFSFLLAPTAWLPVTWEWLCDSPFCEFCYNPVGSFLLASFSQLTGPFLAHGTPVKFFIPRAQSYPTQQWQKLGVGQCGPLLWLFPPWALFFGPRSSGCSYSLHSVFLYCLRFYFTSFSSQSSFS